MTVKVFSAINEKQINPILDFLLEKLKSNRIVTFSGDLGAGKTTLIKQLVKALESDDPVSSPTFSLVNEYLSNNGQKIFHSDWYRINSVAELLDAGIEEYLDDEKALFFIEWPGVGQELLKMYDVVAVNITHRGDYRDYEVESRE